MLVGFSHLAVATGDDPRALAELLQQEPRLQAVSCSSDTLAQGVMVEAQARGLRVPQDLAICGFGNADFAAHLLPAMTTVLIDGPEIGRLAASGQPVAQRVPIPSGALLRLVSAM